MGRTWIEYPIHQLSGPGGRTALIPNDMEMELFDLMLEKAKHEFEKETAATTAEREITNPSPRLWKARQELESIEGMIADAKLSIERKRKKATTLKYDISTPKLGELLALQDKARDFIGNVPTINENRQMLYMLQGGVRLDGSELTNDQVNDLDPDVASKLYGEIRARTYPNLELVPFWKNS